MKLECCYVQLPKIYKHLNGNEFKVFTVIFDEWSMMKNEDGWFYRSLKNLCEDTGLSDRTLRDILKILSEKGVILTTSYNDGVKNATYNKANEYKINMEKVIELSNEKVVKITTSKGCQNEKEEVVKNTKEGGKNYQPTKEEKTKEKIINNITTVNTVPEPKEKIKNKKEKDETSNGPVEDNFNFIDWIEFDDVTVETEPNKNNNNLNNFESMRKENEMSDRGTSVMNAKSEMKWNGEQGSNSVAECGQENEMITSLATAPKNKETAKLQNEIDNPIPAQSLDGSIFTENCPKSTPIPQISAAPPFPLETQETQNKPHDGVKNDAVGSCPTNDEKTQHEPLKCPNLKDMILEMNALFEKTANETDVEKFNTYIKDMEDHMIYFRDNGYKKNYNRYIDQINTWMIQNDFSFNTEILCAATTFKYKWRKESPIMKSPIFNN